MCIMKQHNIIQRPHISRPQVVGMSFLLSVHQSSFYECINIGGQGTVSLDCNVHSYSESKNEYNIITECIVQRLLLNIIADRKLGV